MRLRFALALVIVLACANLACAEIAVFVRNVRVPPPLAWVGNEIYAPRDTILKLFAGAVKDVTVDASGHVLFITDRFNNVVEKVTF